MKKKLSILLLIIFLIPICAIGENDTRTQIGRCNFWIYDGFTEVTQSIGKSLLANLDETMKQTSRVFINANNEVIIVGKFLVADSGSSLYQNEADLFELANEIMKGFQGETGISTLKKIGRNCPGLTITDSTIAWNFLFFPDEIVYYFAQGNDIYATRIYQTAFNSGVIISN